MNHWTKSEVERLRYLAAKGLSVTIIAARLGRTPSSVHSKGRKFGIGFTSSRSSARRAAILVAGAVT